MTRRLLIAYILVLTGCLMPMASVASSVYDAGVMEVPQEPEVSIVYNDGSLLVTGAEGQVVEVVSLTGKKVLSLKLDSPAQKIELNIPKGCYIVKIGKVVRKVSVR